jgi:hypothetical protein
MPGRIDVRDCAQARLGENQIGRFDQRIGRRKRDRAIPRMFRANQSDVPDIAVGAIGDLSRRCEGRERDRDLEPRGERARDARRETRRRTGFVAPGNGQGVAQIDRRAQNSERRKAATDGRQVELLHSRILHPHLIPGR